MKPHFDAITVLDFWLGADFPSATALDAGIKRWFRGGDSVDAAIREQFGETIAAALNGDFDTDADVDPQHWLALLIVLDQFTRNAFRGTSMAFAGDAHALRLALAGIARGDDQRLHPLTRLFCYLPLEHSEDLSLQDRSVALFRSLLDTNDEPDHARHLQSWFDYAIAHRHVIARFGRFPHRNVTLGRDSSSDECTYLAQPGAGF